LLRCKRGIDEKILNNFDTERMRSLMSIKRGEVYWSELPTENNGSVQRGTRPVVILQNDVGNRFSPTTIVAVLTKAGNNKKQIPTHTVIDADHFKDKKKALERKFVTSTFMAEQILTIDLSRLRDKIGELQDDKIQDCNKCVNISLGLIKF